MRTLASAESGGRPKGQSGLRLSVSWQVDGPAGGRSVDDGMAGKQGTVEVGGRT